MRHRSKVDIVGRVGEVVQCSFGSGNTVTKFTIGIDESNAGVGNVMTHTTWFPCSAWGRDPRIKEGDEIHIAGKLSSVRYQNANGTTGNYVEVIVQRIYEK